MGALGQIVEDLTQICAMLDSQSFRPALVTAMKGH